MNTRGLSTTHRNTPDTQRFDPNPRFGSLSTQGQVRVRTPAVVRRSVNVLLKFSSFSGSTRSPRIFTFPDNSNLEIQIVETRGGRYVLGQLRGSTHARKRLLEKM